MAKIKIEDAGAAQLREFARTHLGLEVGDRSTRAQLLAAINASGHEGDEITLEDRVAEVAAQPVDGSRAEPMPDEFRNAQRMRVIIPKQQGGVDPVPVSVNGWAIAIRRGKEVAIPKPHLDVLLNATEFQYPTDEDGNIISEPQEIPSYPVQVLGPA